MSELPFPAKSTEDSGADQIPRHTTPTWEMELLISGATVFALLQLPGLLDEAYARIFPALGEISGAFVRLAYIYLKAGALSLVAAFVLHLALRAYWVAVVGLRSVYPGGIRWDKMRIGPLQRRANETDAPTLDARIESADNRATVVFAVGIAFAMVFLLPLVLVAIMYVAAQLAASTLGRGYWTLGMSLVFAAFLAPLLLANVIDRLVATGRLAPSNPLARGAYAIFRAYVWLRIGRRSNLPLAIFTSQIGDRRGQVLIMAGALLLSLFAIGNLPTRGGVLSLASPGLLPPATRDREDLLRPDHYANLRAALAHPAPIPFIQGDVIADRYLNLFIPYDPVQHAAYVEAHCPGASGAAAGEKAAGTGAGALLACMQGALAITLDGATPTALDFVFAADPGSGLRGFLARMPAGPLAPGRHLVALRRSFGDEQTPPERYLIPFWI